jgi:THO complex subunit 3
VNTGTYIDIVRPMKLPQSVTSNAAHVQCATETGVPLHRVPAITASPTVTWHPSQYVIAYRGQTKTKEVSPPPAAVLSMFGMLE